MSKLKALAKHLNLKIGEVEEGFDEDNFVVKSRKVREGDSPKYYYDSIEEFKKLLDKKSINKISAFLTLGSSVSEETRDKIYKNIKTQIKDKPVVKDWLYNESILYWLLDNENTNKTSLKVKKIWFGKVIKDDRELVERNEGEYMVLTEDEADEKWEEELEAYIDEIILPELPETAQNYFDRESWKSDARTDGRGHSLNRYDGTEESIEFENETLYIYRTN